MQICKVIRSVVALAGIVLPLHSNGATPLAIVQWGQPGGQADMVAARIDGGWDIGTNYSGTVAASPVDPGYYPASAAANRTPVFYGAGTVERKVEVRDNGNGDECWIHGYTESGGTYRGMLVWKAEDFLDLGLATRFEIEVRNRNATDQGQISWLVEKNGNWYISGVAGEVNTTGFTSISGNSIDMTWYEFTPFVNGLETIGPAAQITLDGITSVGFYWDTLNTEAASRWVGATVNYFAVATLPRAIHYSGCWAPRVQLPAKNNGTERTDFTNFDVSAFVDQLVQLNTAGSIHLNLSHGAIATYYLSSHPDLATAVNSDMFPTERDLLTEVLDELALRGDERPVFVYQAAHGIKESSCPPGAWSNWTNHYASLGYTDHHHAVADLIIAYYAQKHGDRIDGWWFDGANTTLSAENQQRYFNAARLGNPHALITMPVSSGAPLKSSPWCDFTSGHPFAVTVNEPWSSTNLLMIENIEAGPWLDQNGVPVSDIYDGALGHAYLPLQRTWNSGEPFPVLQAIDWTTRSVEALGMFTWSLNRQGSLIESINFDTLLKINEAMTNSVVVASGENAPNETAVKAFDGDIYTKWLTFTNAGWIAYDYTSTNAYAVTQYSITSANDADSRDPKNWEFQGSNDGGMSWDTLDTQVNQDFTARYQTKSYTTANSTAYKVYRLNITANNGDPKTQLAELELNSGAPAPNNAPTFTSDPINEINATEDVAYSSTIADDASDPDSDPLTFSRVSGPAWLTVASNGALSGTPMQSDVGSNSWTVQVSDGNGGMDTATLNITVDAAVVTPHTDTLTVVDGWNEKDGKIWVEDGKVYVFNSSDDDRWQVEMGGYYITTEMSNISFPAGAVIDSVKVYCEHYEESGFNSSSLEWQVGTSWPSGATTWGTLASAPVNLRENSETTDVWDVSAYVDTPQKVNDLEFFIKNNHGQKKTSVDRVYIVVDWHE